MSLEEDVRNLREVQTAFEDFNDDSITFREAMDALNRLPGHRELKDTINGLSVGRLTERMRSATAIRTIVVEIQRIQSIPIAVAEPYDSEPELTEVYEDIDSDTLAEMSTDEDTDDEGPPKDSRLRF